MPRLVHHAIAALIPPVMLAVTSPAPATLEAAPASVADCNALAKLALPETTISAATIVTAGAFTPPNGRGGRVFADAPAFCQVHGVLAPTPQSKIHFEVW